MTTALSTVTGGICHKARAVQRFKRFIRRIRPPSTADSIASIGLGAALLAGTLFFLPRADAESTRAALTVIAEILGVILGAVLVVAGFMIEQRWQAEGLLRRVYPQYHAFLEGNTAKVDGARRELVDHKKRGTIDLDQPVFVGPSGLPSHTRFRDAINAISALTHVLCSGSLAEEIVQDLEDLGYSRDEIADALYIPSANAAMDPEAFLRLADHGLDLTWICKWCSEEASEVAVYVFRRYERDGVRLALARLGRSRDLLHSKLLAASIVTPALTVVFAIVAILGTTDRALSSTFRLWGSALITTAFVASVALALSLIRRMLRDAR